MPSLYTPTSLLSSDPFLTENRGNSRNPLDETSAIFDQLRSVLANYLEQPASAELWKELLTARRAVSFAIARFPRKELQSTLVYDARQLVQEMSRSGVHDRVINSEDLNRAGEIAAKGWPGLLAAMLLTPAWQWSAAPLLLEVPEWLLADYVGWLFAAPQGFSEIGQAETYAAHTLCRLEELVRWVKRGPGVNAEAEVLGAYVTHASVIPLYFSTSSLRRHAELRGLLYLRALGQPGDYYEAPPVPREGRRLRIGFVNRHFGSQTETYTTLPTFEQLDPERFETILFSHKSGGSNLEEYCRSKAADYFVLPEDVEGQLSMLRAAALDVVVFGTNVTAVCNEVTRLALHRVAPLQVVNNSSCITSGFPEVDLYVSGTLTETAKAPAQFSERLGLLPGPTHAFNYEADRQEPQSTISREDCGIPQDAIVFASAANYFKIIPEMQHQWAKLLAAVPGSYLLVHPFNPNWTSNYPIKRFQSEFEAVLQLHGVDHARLVISTTSFPSRTDVKTLLSLGDIYLDTFPFGGVNSLVDPLELGLPVVTWDGVTMRSRMGGALLRSLDLPEMIASSAEEYHAIALQLAADPASRQILRERLQARMERMPLFLDTLAASDAMGELLEVAYDEMATVGRKAFRANPVPLQAASVTPASTEALSANPELQARLILRAAPNDATARHALGRSLLDAGRAGRAGSYFLAAIQSVENKPDLWLDLAHALKLDGRTSEAIQALEASLRMDQNQLEGWLMLAELAEAVGVHDLARDAAGVAQKLAPGDSRASAYL